MPTYLVLLLLTIAGALSNGLEQYLMFQNANNKDVIEVLDLYVYNIGIDGGRIPLSTVIGMSKSLISITLLLFANRLSKFVRGEGII
jgi:putative aldouronate transport system permease protein